MNRTVRHYVAPLLLLAMCHFAIFCICSVGHASSLPAGSVDWRLPVDPDQRQYDDARPAGKKAADLNVGEPRTVRMIYFLPKDRQALPDIDATFDALMNVVQQSYAEQMEYHGFGRKTFRFETGANGKALVHHVKGKFSDVHYHADAFWKVQEEVIGRFDLERNIYLVSLDVSYSRDCGWGLRRGPEGGMAVIPDTFLKREHAWSCGNVALIAHELGHAFGLSHDSFRNAARSPSSYHTDWMVTSFAAAEWLDVHRYFNVGQSYPERDEPTTIQMIPPSAVPPSAVRVRFKVSDPDGLHQVQLFNSIGEAIDFLGVKGKNGTVDFVTQEVTEAPGNNVGLRVIDVYGNVRGNRYPIDILALLTHESVSIPDENLAAVVRETLDLAPGETVTQLRMLRLRSLPASSRHISDLAGLEHAVNIIDLDLGGNQVRDVTPLTGLIILKVLALWNNRISDIQPLMQMNSLERLWLSGNSVSDLSPCAGLTSLKVIHLRGNPIVDETPLYGILRRNPFLEIDIELDIQTLEIISGDGQEGAPGAALADSMIVQVRDQSGEPLGDVVVTFTVTAGGGTLSDTTITTDAHGRASTTLTLGRTPGTNTVVVTLANLKPVIFTAIVRVHADFNGDGTVGFPDFLQFAAHFGLSHGEEGFDARFDLDGNGAIGFSDFVIFAGTFGKSTS